MQSVKTCDCSLSGRSPNCNGSCGRVDALRTGIQIEKERKLEPRVFGGTISSDHENMGGHIQGERFQQDSSQKGREYGRIMNNGGMIDDEDLKFTNRNPLRKFESLNVHGQTLGGLTIGGFDVDLNTAAQKAMEILPMPAAKLPVIFIDDELNFLHHFFQGLARMIGGHILETIARKTQYYEDEPSIIFPLIEDLIVRGYDNSDSEMVLLLKRVFLSTFKIVPKRRYNEDNEEVLVVANLWGFQYIECGMQMNESDLQMWISINHAQYKTAWFNTFKCSGVPLFAHGGSNKSRSSSSTSSRSSVDRPLYDLKEEVEEDSQPSVRHKHHSRSRRAKSVRSSSGGSMSNALTSYIAGRR